MSKSVVVMLDGDLEDSGFRAILEIGGEGAIASIQMFGSLPPNPELAQRVRSHWKEIYPRAVVAARIKPQEIIFGGSVNHISECQQSENKLSDLLNDWLKYEGFRPLSDRLRESLNPEEPIRFLIRTECRDIPKLPWHKWDFSQRYRRAEIAFSSLEYEMTENLRQKSVKNQIRILAILGDSTGIDIEADRKIIENLPNAETTFLIKPELYKLNERLWEQPWDILFFAGHSKTEGDTGLFYINETDSITIDELWYALRKAVEGGLKLAIFNSCDGLGLARQLDDVQVPQMIVMRERVPDRVAQEFLKHFLRGFASGKTLYLAAREARERLQGLERTYPCACWLPVIWQNPAEVPPTWAELSGQTASLPIALPLPEKKETLPRRNWRSFKSALLASFICAIAVMGGRSLGLLQASELQAYDHLMRQRPYESLDERILIVEITETDIQKFKQYPLKDITAVRLMKKLEEYRPRVIGLDIYRDIPQEPGRSDLLNYLQQSDRAIAVCNIGGSQSNPSIKPPDGIRKKLGIGFNDVLPDSDKIIRRHLLATDPKSSPCQTDKSFSLQVARRYLAAANIHLDKVAASGYFQLGSAVFPVLEKNAGGYRNLDDRGHQVMIDYRSAPKVALEVSVDQVLSDRVDPDLVRDRAVLIGYTSPSQKDFYLTPIGEMPGVVLQAQMVSQILSAVEDRRPLIWLLPEWSAYLWVWIWAALGSVLAWRIRTPLHLGLGVAASLSLLYGICFFLLLKGGWFPLIPAALALVGTAGIVAISTASLTQK